MEFPVNANAEPRPGLFFRFPTYLLRWLAFGVLAGLATPVISPEPSGAMPDEYFWHVKLLQVGFGLAFALPCAVVFTVLQNLLNKQRSRGRSWAILIGTWLGVKLVFYAVGMAFGLTIQK